MPHPRQPRRHLVALLALGTLVLTSLVAPAAHATNASTKSGNRTVACAVDWYAQSDLSLSLTADHNGDGAISGDENSSNQGYLYEVSSSTTYPAVHGPGDFLLHHWINPEASLGFRLPLATDHTRTTSRS